MPGEEAIDRGTPLVIDPAERFQFEEILGKDRLDTLFPDKNKPLQLRMTADGGIAMEDGTVLMTGEQYEAWVSEQRTAFEGAFVIGEGDEIDLSITEDGVVDGDGKVLMTNDDLAGTRAAFNALDDDEER